MPSVVLFYAVKWSVLVIGAQEFWGSSPGALPDCTNPSGLMFADGQCSIISCAGASCQAGGTDASCGLQDSESLQLGFCNDAGKAERLGQEFEFGFIF